MDLKLAAGDRHSKVVDEGSELTIESLSDVKVFVNEVTSTESSPLVGCEGLAFVNGGVH